MCYLCAYFFSRISIFLRSFIHIIYPIIFVYLSKDASRCGTYIFRREHLARSLSSRRATSRRCVRNERERKKGGEGESTLHSALFRTIERPQNLRSPTSVFILECVSSTAVSSTQNPLFLSLIAEGGTRWLRART